jgi:hypothetical protein
VSERGKNLLLLAVTVCVTLLACEIAARRLHHISLRDFSNFALSGRERLKTRLVLRPDDLLGWALRDNVDTPDIHTVDHGVRRNSSAQTGLRRGGILAVGSSYTFGFQLDDTQSWPAQLERLLGRPVDNAAGIAYGLDQIVLRAEELLPVAQPQVLLVGLAAELKWTMEPIGMEGGAAKPFFTLERGELVAHGVPESVQMIAGPLSRVLGYSFMYSYAHKIAYASWHAHVTMRNTNPVDLSCRLLRRLKQASNARGALTVLVSESPLTEVLSRDKPKDITAIEDCARDAGYRVVDVFAGFTADEAATPERATQYYAENLGGVRVHFSEAGNRRVAELVAAALQPEPASTTK